MFTIIAIDGKEYGPVSGERMRGWLAEKRVSVDSLAKSSESGTWKRLGEYPEFSDFDTQPPVIGGGQPLASESDPEEPIAEAPSKKWGKGGLLVVFGLFGLVLILGIVASLSRPSNSNPSAPTDNRRTFDESKQKFEASMPEKYKELLALRNAGRFEEATTIVRQFENFKRLDYQSMAKIAPEIHTACDLARLGNTTAGDTRSLSAIYSELSQLHPENKEYENNAKKFAAEWKQQEARRIENERQEAEQHRITEERQARISAQFSAWDGSHRGLEEIIKQSMNDPDSYKHVETRYTDMGDFILVKTTFRGKNKFGGVVKNWVEAKFTVDGAFIETVGQGP